MYNSWVVFFLCFARRAQYEYIFFAFQVHMRDSVWALFGCYIWCEVNLHFILFYTAYRYRQTRFSSRRVRKRVIFKHGDVNVVQGNVAKRRRRYLQVNFTQWCNSLTDSMTSLT